MSVRKRLLTIASLVIAGAAASGAALAGEPSPPPMASTPATTAPAATAAGSGASAAPSGEEERWSSFLPLMADEARARGYALPLPFGVGTTFTVLGGRDIEVTDLRIGLNGEKPRSVSQYVDLGTSSDVFNANLKLDVWILPFLNVYALLGYVYNESETTFSASVPRPGPIPGTFDATTSATTKLEGFVGGAGLTLAAGYKQFFMVADTNYSQTDLGFDDRFRAFVASLRTGYQTSLADRNFQFFIGVSYWDTENTAKGHVRKPDGTRIDFEADQGPVSPWFMDFGFNVRLHGHFELTADVGVDFRGGFVLALVPVFRF